jgi:hypothetical protein
MSKVTRSTATVGTVAGAVAMAAALALQSGAAYAQTDSVNAGNASVGSGNQVQVPLNIGADVCGLAVALLGGAQSSCQGTATTASGSGGGSGSGASGGGNGTNGTNAGNLSAGSSNKVSVPVSVPINICGVSIAILGNANSGCQGTSTVVVHPASPGAPGGGPGGSGPGRPGPGRPGGSGPGGSGPGGWGPGGWTPGGSGPGSPGNHGSPTCGCENHKHHKHHKGSKTSHTHKSQYTTTTVTTTKPRSTPPPTTAVLTSSALPTTGFNLIALLVAALAFLGIGGGALAANRRLRPRPESEV